MKKIATLILLTACAVQAQAQNPHVWLDTDRGPIILELYPDDAPITVENFLRYVDDGFYDELIFHRVAEDFVIQGGGFDSNRNYREPTYDPIASEANNGLSNQPGWIGMARQDDPDSATSQFYVNTADNDFLDDGYTVFGEVVFGMATVDKINDLESINSPYSSLHQHPFNPPLIKRAVQSEGFPLMPDHSGSWYDPQTSGVGFNIEIADDNGGNGPMALVYWYNFDQQRQFWLVGNTAFDYGAGEVTMNLLSHPVNDEGAGFQNPPESGFSTYGTLTLSFESCTSGTVEYDMPGYGSGEIAISRLSRPDGYNCGD